MTTKTPRAAEPLGIRSGGFANGTALSFAVIALLAVFLALEGYPTVPLRVALFDAYQVVAPRLRASQPGVVVVVDEAALNQFGQWPWPRDLAAQLITRIHAANPAAVGLDMFYPEVDRLSPKEWINSARGLPIDLRKRLAAFPSNDKILGDAIAAGPTVVGIVGVGSADFRFDRISESVSASKTSSELKVQSFGGYIGSLSEIQRGATRLGLMNGANDPGRDGKTRKAVMLARIEGQTVGLLAIETLGVATGAALSLEPASFGRAQLRLGNLVTSTEPDGTKWIRWGSVDPERYISAAEVLSGRVDPKRLENKVVFVGVSGLGIIDFKRTPLGEFVPSAEVHLQVLEEMVDGTSLSRGVAARWLEIVVAVAVALILVAFAQKHGAVKAGGLLIVVLVAGLALGFVSFLHGTLIDVVNPVVMWTAVYGVILTTSLIAARRAKEKAIYMFSRFVNPHVVEELLKDESFSQAAQAREITILFSDIRNFTTLSEKRSPAEVVFLLNRYFERQVEVVFAHKGAVDKFIGDAIMAFWGAPLEEPDQASLAVSCALDLLDAVEEFRKDMGLDPGTFDIGIGIHTGRAVVGLIGSEQRREYTAVGSPVNLANRIETLTKETGHKLLVSAETRARCGDAFDFELVGTYPVKGIERPVEVFAPRRRQSQELVKPPL
jgi:adenylate cyclase